MFGLFTPVMITGCEQAGNSAPTSKYMNHSKSSAFSDGTGYLGMWLNDELEYIVFVPFGGKVDCISSPGPLETRPKGLTIGSNGLYCDGKRVDTSGMRKVFVLLEGGNLRPIEISQEHLPYLRLSNIQELEDSPVWLFFRSAIEEAQ